ncbi:hypothetical protein OGAPHI_003923 [Ogataea philodendri]|uniref:Ribosomal RNA-processing protein 1 n=1 Tax=Ogataea philodendri TaxID=1378263 RepID=A0A9P8T554_9ASCO|nr:uncharacterized protein OGAPHI_003923 [Ogataea philodendri]KAH3665735.1 hypothetical protein OGAPHI_003923 [Ogataea philodendri]
MKKVQTKTFVKKLSSTDRKIRDHAFETLKQYLGERSDVRPLKLNEFEKLWEGLYYTMWFSDRPRPQQKLANDLANLFSETITKQQFCLFVQAFWAVICKEWPEIDQWRVDKFYLLMRYVIRECFVRLQENSWEEELVDQYVHVLESQVLSGKTSIPNGVTYHVIDVYLDELERTVVGEDEEDVQEKFKDVPLEKLLQPFKKLETGALMKTLRLKVRDDVSRDERLQKWGYVESVTEKQPENDDEEEEWTGFD